jgi:hypothetical protein
MTPELHISDPQIDEYAAGVLAPEALPGLEEHLLVCKECQVRLQAADEFTKLFRAAAAEPDIHPTSIWTSVWRRFIPVPAIAAVACASVLIVSRFSSSSGVPATVLLQSLRGPEASAVIAPRKPALLLFDLPSLDTSAYDVEVVDDNGGRVLNPVVRLQDGHLSVLVSKLPAGSYWVRVYRRSSHELIVEYGLKAK